MKTFDGIKFKGTFRVYQQRVLDNTEKYLSNKKIHIVAAPGSGKTILGLEIIRRLNQPAIIFSPSITIKNQWQDRFKMFLSEGENVEDFVSLNLKELSLITSATYQGLYSALNKLKETENEAEELHSEYNDYSDFDLIKEVKKIGVKTICLDEAHHLTQDWHNALTKFTSLMGDDVSIVSLTATPPYDADSNEWEKYEKLCGKIDEEVGVPELVEKNNLCPHQDFIYYNYPTSYEAEVADVYYRNTMLAIEEIARSETVANILNKSATLFQQKKEEFYDNISIFSGAYLLAKQYKLKADSLLTNFITKNTSFKRFDLATVTKWLNLFRNSQDEYLKQEFDNIFKILKKYDLVHKNKIMLGANEKINKMIMTSQGKMQSIVDIVEIENRALKQDLRMLILTDYIKKDGLKLLGTEKPFSNISVVSIFETIRRSNPSLKLAVLSGTIVILKQDLKQKLEEICSIKNCSYQLKNIANTEYMECVFKGVSNKNKVAIVTKLFQDGLINVVVGTSSLLGEGWDSPNINSLILASFVGSFMLSNQMRGRAIRIDSNNPNKISNIWHLVTILPNGQEFNVAEDDVVCGSDFQTVARRFKTFVAPHYKTYNIEDGVERVGIPQSFDEYAIKLHNKHTALMAVDRNSTKLAWDKGLKNLGGRFRKSANFAINKNVPKIKLFIKDFFSSSLVFAYILLFLTSMMNMSNQESMYSQYFFILNVYCLFVVLYKILKLIYNNKNPYRILRIQARATLSLLKSKGLISRKAFIKTKRVKFSDKTIRYQFYLINADNLQQEAMFISSIKETVSTIQNPRYILVKKIMSEIVYSSCFVVPKEIGENKAAATAFAKTINNAMGGFLLVYTRTKEGSKILNRAKELSKVVELYKT